MLTSLWPKRSVKNTANGPLNRMRPIAIEPVHAEIKQRQQISKAKRKE